MGKPTWCFPGRGLKTWVLGITGVMVIGLGAAVGGVIGISGAIWLLEGGDPFAGFIYAQPGKGELSLARGVGLIFGAALGVGASGVLVLLIWAWLGLWDVTYRSTRGGS